MSEQVIAVLRARLGAPDRHRIEPGLPVAAVAMLLRPGDGRIDMLLIRRAVRAGDIWSGHVALPGGRMDDGDASLVETARREALEEVGIDPMEGGELLGSLEPVRPRNPAAPRIAVHPFVWLMPSPPSPVLNVEVDAASWIDLAWVASPEARVVHRLRIDGAGQLEVPGIRIGDDVLWGITHRIVGSLVEMLPG